MGNTNTCFSARVPSAALGNATTETQFTDTQTTAVRLIPVPGKDVGEKAVFGGLFGEAYIIEVRNLNQSSAFVRFGGRIPAPITSLSN